ncbi:MAG: LD-carboxypeptidase [Candidatus Omnitrophica bacterium]|nr:LD-carboxypeptidase [Candidatus Omnitrophota bacterium]
MRRRKATKPARLKKGDTIGIVAPAWSFDIGNFKRGIDKLRKLGFKVKFDRSIFSKYWSMAGYDKERAQQINRMFADKEVKAIFCAKAGYGSIRTIPYLNKKIIKRNPKIFIGYSDITILLSYLYKTVNMVVFHGPVVSDEIHDNMNSITLDYLLQAITQPIALGELHFSSLRSLRPGKATGVLVGGNMSLFISALGTAYDIDTDNKILFLEDIGEDLEVIDNYLMHLKLSGKFRKLKGIVFGRMIDCLDYSGKRYTIRDILNDILHDAHFPIIYGFPSGHRGQGEIDVTLPFGVPVTIDADYPKLVINEAGVKR